MKRRDSGTKLRTRPRAGHSLAGSAESRQVALDAAQAGLDKKAFDVQVIDLQGRADYADYLVLMSGQSDRHVAALAAFVESELHRRGVRAHGVEGLPRADWVIVDFVDVVVHVFQDALRHEYDLDGLWMDAARVPLPVETRGEREPG